jgi:hypothetical protein
MSIPCLHKLHVNVNLTSLLAGIDRTCLSHRVAFRLALARLPIDSSLTAATQPTRRSFLSDLVLDLTFQGQPSLVVTITSHHQRSVHLLSHS